MNDEDIKIISKYTLAAEDQASDAETSDAQRHDILSYKSDTDFILSRDHLTDEWKDFEKTSKAALCVQMMPSIIHQYDEYQGFQKLVMNLLQLTPQAA